MARPAAESWISPASISVSEAGSDAGFSADGHYRWWLRRSWPGGHGTLLFIGLNPSAADGRRDDPTLRRLIGFGRGWGYSALVVLNLFAFWRLRESDALKWTLLFWLAQALSFLTKGPVGLAIVALTILGFRGFGGKVPWKKMFRWQGLLLGAAVVTPWYATVFHKYPNLFYYLFEFQTVERVATEVHGRGGPIWFFLPVILAGFFPWSFRNTSLKNETGNPVFHKFFD